MRRVFVDTAPFIYLIEGHPEFASRVERYLDDGLRGDLEFVSSVITYLEFCVEPLREKRTDVVERFQDLILDISLILHSIDLATAKQASELRAKYSFLKTADALQLASALVNSCEMFLTNDKELSPVKELEVVLLQHP